MTLQPIGFNPNMLPILPNYIGQYDALDSIFGSNSICMQQANLNNTDPFATLYTGGITDAGALPFDYSMFYYTPTLPISSDTYPQIDYSIPQYNLGMSNYNLNLYNIPKFGEITKKFKTSDQETEDGTTSSLNLSDKELERLGFNTPDLKSRWKHLKPEFQRALIKLTDYAESKGIKISYGRRSTWRSAQDQIDIKKERGRYAAKPGHSPHEKGIAVDITTTSVNGNKRSNSENLALLGAYWEKIGYRWGGHFKNFAQEPWHFDLKAARS